MKLLFIIISSIIPINFANGMLTITSTDQTGPQFTLTIDTATAPKDMLEVLRVAKNPILKDFEKRVEQPDADRVALGKSYAKENKTFENITEQEALEAYNSDLTLQMLGALKQRDANCYVYMLPYLYSRYNDRRGLTTTEDIEYKIIIWKKLGIIPQK